MSKYILIIISFFLLFCPVEVVAISAPLAVPNNKFGIHILSPDEIELAAKLVNSSGGDWGYATIPIQAPDRDLEKWQKFMDKAKELHIIPIIRLTTLPISENWQKPDDFDLVDFGNFLNSLDWPIKNRYLIIYNEVNRASEWGGELNPEAYAFFLNKAIDILKSKSPDFFILNAGLDGAAPNNHVLMDEYTYLKRMEAAVPGIFQKLDGWNSHSYPNPDFSAKPYENRRNTIYGFRYELSFLGQYGVNSKPVFITETGWRKDGITPVTIGKFYEQAFNAVWSDKNIVAITPFLLTAGAGPFEKFSFTDGGGNPLDHFIKYVSIPKIAGKPKLAPIAKNLTINHNQNNNLSKVASEGFFLDTLPYFWKNILKYLFWEK